MDFLKQETRSADVRDLSELRYINRHPNSHEESPKNTAVSPNCSP